jgi:hypothetical protein
MPLSSTSADNQALQSLTGTLSGASNLVAYVSLHSGSPGTTGANEFTGGSYARLPCNWNAPSNGQMTNSSTLTFSTTGGTAATYFGTFGGSSGAAYGIGGALASPVTASTITFAPGSITMGAS